MPSDPRDWIAISQLPGIGPATLAKLFRGKWTPDRLIADQHDSFQLTSPHLTSPGPGSQQLSFPRLNSVQIAQLTSYVKQTGPLWEKTNQFVNQLDAMQIQCILSDSDSYPALLRKAADHPVLLFVQGNLEALHLPIVSIVGSRNASAAGLRHAYQFSASLSQAGFVVASGLALGIDGAAHQAAVDLGLPTVAVMGTGSDRLYPLRHKKLSEKILGCGGALVTELLPGSGPLAAHFPRRNRIISGLSTGVLVVEAALKSGSLITARLGLNQGREVFALPGSIDHPGSRGCHALIREGAVLVESVEHMLDELSTMLGVLRQASDNISPSSQENNLSTDQNLILTSIDFSLTLLEEIVDRLGLLDSPLTSHLQSSLVELELFGWIEAVGGGYRRIR
ncbi:DNA-processing protein DprA [Neptunomonas antarctica]|uniref:DNA processing protein n=1 Tax=Neptunomonas antarctica TaxID=619304 RepID=A0A1N7IU46_9GAMM|nr:DNA-processing protein DprA [Neptunomonas antarctica]SIS40560.1 DNA processing protein [Neptunomonas antarctica]